MIKPITDAEFRRKLDEHLAGAEPFDVLADTERDQADLNATAQRLALSEAAARDWLESESSRAEIEPRPMPGAGPVGWLLVGVLIVGMMLGGWLVWAVLHAQ